MANLISECCGANAYFSLGEVHGIYMEGKSYIGVCSECKEGAIFQELPDDDYYKDMQYNK
jgi:hypothetical protein